MAAKPKVILALKEAHREWPRTLSYPLLMTGIELILKAAIRKPNAKANYEISIASIHDEIETLVKAGDLPHRYRIAHDEVTDQVPRSNREEVLAMALYNEFRLGAQGLPFGTLGPFSALDYQIPVVCGKRHGLGCIDLLGVVQTSDGAYRPVVVELKGQGTPGFNGSGTDCPHFALLEAWTYLILFLRNLQRYTKELGATGRPYRPSGGEVSSIQWKRPILAIVAPHTYWSHWARSDQERGYAGPTHWADCCALLETAYARYTTGSLDHLDVVGVSLVNTVVTKTHARSRDDIHLQLQGVEITSAGQSTLRYHSCPSTLWGPWSGHFDVNGSKKGPGGEVVRQAGNSAWVVEAVLPPTFVAMVRAAVDARDRGFTADDRCDLDTNLRRADIVLHDTDPIARLWQEYVCRVSVPLDVRQD